MHDILRIVYLYFTVYKNNTQLSIMGENIVEIIKKFYLKLILLFMTLSSPKLSAAFSKMYL